MDLANQYFHHVKERNKSKFQRNGADFRNMLLEHKKSGNLGHTLSLQPYQVTAVETAKGLLDHPDDGEKPVLIAAPTGSGKSFMVVMLPYFLESKKVLIITPSRIIRDQIADSFNFRPRLENSFFHKTGLSKDQEGIAAFFETVTVISLASTALEHSTSLGNLVIGDAHTLDFPTRSKQQIIKLMEFFDQFDTVIVYKAHHYCAPTWKHLLHQLRIKSTEERKKIIFVTATPYRNDDNGKKVPVLPESLNRIVTITKEECIGKTLRPKPKIHENEDEITFASDIINLLKKQQESEPRFQHQAMVLAESKSHKERIVAALNTASGNLQFAVDLKSHTDKNVREFTSGNYTVAVVCKVALEGYDNTSVSVCVIMKKLCTERVTLSQFVGYCICIKRNLPKIGSVDDPDRTVPQILTYKQYNNCIQHTVRQLYDEMDQLAIHDPDLVTDSDSDRDDRDFAVHARKLRKVK